MHFEHIAAKLRPLLRSTVDPSATLATTKHGQRLEERMAMRNALETSSVRARVGEEEWQARVELAAAYRLVAKHGWTNLVNNHISLRVPGTEDQFLINPYGLLYEQITASNLAKIDVNGKKITG